MMGTREGVPLSPRKVLLMTFVVRQRLLLGLAVILMLAPTMMYAGGKLGQAPMFEGDTKKEMSCLACDGLGKIKGENCTTCYGRGFADYIIPGSERPIQLVGTLKDGKGKPLVGSEISITEPSVGGPAIVMKTNDDGQFGFKFPPGEFHLEMVHPESGLQGKEDLKVEANSEPILATGSETLHKLERTFTLK